MRALGAVTTTNGLLPSAFDVSVDSSGIVEIHNGWGCKSMALRGKFVLQVKDVQVCINLVDGTAASVRTSGDSAAVAAEAACDAVIDFDTMMLECVVPAPSPVFFATAPVSALVRIRDHAAALVAMVDECLCTDDVEV